MRILNLISTSWSGLTSFGSSGSKQVKGSQQPLPSSNAVTVPLVISEESCLQISTAWACVRLLVENISTLPLTIYERLGNGERTTADEHRLNYVLNRKPNSRQTPTEYRQTQLLNLILHGNSYSRIERNVSGQIIALWPYSSEQMETKVLEDGSIVHCHHVSGNVEVIAAENMLHIKLLGNGIVGLSPLGYARVTLGIAAATDQYAGSFYANGAKPGGILTIDKVLSETQREAIRKNFSGLTEGAENSFKLFVLEGGMKFEQTSFNAEDAQMLKTRSFNVEDICRFFGVPSFLVNNTATTTWGSGIEQMMLGFFTLTIRTYLKLIEDSYNCALLKPAEWSKFYVEHNFEALLRADSKGRAEYYSSMTNNGLMTRAEARKKENLPFIEGSDELTVQVNLVPLTLLGKQQ
jgi:HK97 family phage portal protein